MNSLIHPILGSKFEPNPGTKGPDVFIANRKIKSLRDYFAQNPDINVAQIVSLDCSDNDLSTLDDCPPNLTKLNCRGNIIFSLQGIPETLKWLDCSNNQIDSLQYCPQNLQDLFCSENNITTLKYCPPNLRKLYISDNPLQSLIGLPRHLEKLEFWSTGIPAVIQSAPIKSIYKYLDELEHIKAKAAEIMQAARNWTYYVEIMNSAGPYFHKNWVAELMSDPAQKKKYFKYYFANFGFPAEFLDRILLYPSGRPRTDFSTMVVVDSDADASLPVLTDESPVLVSANYLGAGIFGPALIPVARYGCGAHGCYYKTAAPAAPAPAAAATNYCGTWYYFEPASDILLHADTILVIQNKYECMKYFGIPNDQIARALNAKWPMNVAMYFDVMENNNTFRNHNPLLYAKEDVFDQQLCEIAHFRGIQVVIFAYMTGKTRIVTEILDTRLRVDSYDALKLRGP